MRWLLGRETLTSPIPCPVFCFTEVCGRAPFQRPREQLQLSDSQPKSKSKSKLGHALLLLSKLLFVVVKLFSKVSHFYFEKFYLIMT